MRHSGPDSQKTCRPGKAECMILDSSHRLKNLHMPYEDRQLTQFSLIVIIVIMRTPGFARCMRGRDMRGSKENQGFYPEEW